MHARELVELAALVSAHGPVLVRLGQRIPEENLEHYWVASRSRLDRWSRAVKRLQQQAALHVQTRQHVAEAYRGLFEEIVTGEVLTRVWAAVCCAYDRAQRVDQMEPIARSIHLGHMEARHRVLNLLVNRPAVASEDAVRLNRLRCRADRWTDMLIGYLTGLDDVSQFAADPERARDFAEDLRYRGHLPGGQCAWPLTLASIRGFAAQIRSESPNPDLNEQIAASVVACFPPDAFDSTGLPKSLFLVRLARTASDAQGMIDQLLAAEGGAAEDASDAKARGAARVRRFGA